MSRTRSNTLDQNEFREWQKSFARVFDGNLKPFNFYFYQGQHFGFHVQIYWFMFYFLLLRNLFENKTKTSQMCAVSINVEGFFNYLYHQCLHLQSWARRSTPARQLKVAVQHTRVRSICPINFSRDQSSNKLIIFLDSRLDTWTSRLKTQYLKLSRIEAQGTVNLLLSGTVHLNPCSSWSKYTKHYN